MSDRRISIQNSNQNPKSAHFCPFVTGHGIISHRADIFDRALKILARNHAEVFLRLAFPGQETRLIGTVAIFPRGAGTNEKREFC